MSKFDIEIDEKNIIWGRYRLEIEAESLEEAKKIAFKTDLTDKPVEWLLESATYMTRKENAAMSVADYLLPDDNWETLYGFDDKDIETLEIVN